MRIPFYSQDLQRGARRLRARFSPWRRPPCQQARNRRAFFEPLEDRRMLATFAVTTFADEFGGGGLSLREAITMANANGNGVVDVIFLPAGTYALNRTGAGEDQNASGQLSYL